MARERTVRVFEVLADTKSAGPAADGTIIYRFWKQVKAEVSRRPQRDHRSLGDLVNHLIGIELRLECVAALATTPGYRIWATPDMPRRCAITFGGTEQEARAAVVAGFYEKLCGDWSYEAILMTEPPAATPCRWCAKGNGYAH